MKLVLLSSLTNTRIKRVVQLRKAKVREKEGLMIVEGQREILQAIEAKVDFQEIYISNISNQNLDSKILNLMQSKILIYETTQTVFSKIAYGQKEEGFLAICKMPKYGFLDFKKEKNPLFVVVESVEKPGNLGAILRTCDGVGVTGVLVCEEKTDIYNANVIRASLGTVFSVKVVSATNEEVASFLQKNNIKKCATLPLAQRVYTKANLNQPIAIIMGSEEKGLSDFWSQQADLQVSIPMNGKVDSLNVSTSAAILLYETLRQRA